MRHVIGFGRFWYDFVVGDDPFIALGVALAIALTYILGASAWLLLPIAVVALLGWSLRRATQSTLTDAGDSENGPGL